MALRPLRGLRKNGSEGPSGDGTTASAVRPAHPPATSRWLFLRKDGRLSAYAATEGGLLCWAESRPGGPAWDPPRFVPVRDVAHVAFAQGADGYVHLVAPRGAARGDDRADAGISHATQYQTGRRTTRWHSIGRPFADTEHAGGLGQPAATVGHDGSLYVLSLSAGGRACLRAEKRDGRWADWVELPGDGGHRSLAACTTASRIVHALGVGDDKVEHWAQPGPGARIAPCDAFPVRLVGGSMTPLETAPERLSLYGTDAGTGELVVHRPGGDTVALGLTPSGSPPAVLRTLVDGHDRTVLAVRDRDGRVRVAAFPTGAEEAGVDWVPTGEPGLGAPALASDGHGRVVVATVAADGGLRVSRGTIGAGLALEPWTRAAPN